jgi:hypothetical protein
MKTKYFHAFEISMLLKNDRHSIMKLKSHCGLMSHEKDERLKPLA